VTENTHVCGYDSSVGEIHFDGGTLETGSLWAGTAELPGTGTISARGIIADADVVFDSPETLSAVCTYDSRPGQNITVHLAPGGQDILGAGYSGTGSLVVRNGVHVSSTRGHIGYHSGAVGTVTVEGPGSTWADDGDLYVGDAGSGTLSITGGGTVSNAKGYIGHELGSTGRATVHGADSDWTNSSELHIGYSGSGILVVTGGGRVSSSLSFIGRDSESTGTVTVEGPGSTWTSSSSVYVGYRGNGTLAITKDGLVKVAHDTYVKGRDEGAGVIHFDGGTLETESLWAAATELTGTGTISTRAIIADADVVFDSADDLTSVSFAYDSQPGQDITIRLAPNSQGFLGAGYGGAGSLAIRNDVDVSSQYGYVGYKAGATGEVTVEGPGSTWTIGKDLYVGDSGRATLTIADGGLVRVTGSTYAGRHEGSAGAIHLDGGTLETGSLLAGAIELAGTGTVFTHGIIADAHLVFDSVDDLPVLSFVYDGYSGQNVTIHLAVDGKGVLGAGCSGDGSLAIRNAVSVSSKNGCIGYKPGATGEVTVEGTGSNWTNGSDLDVGCSGSGTLLIAAGGTVSNASGYLGRNSGSTGQVSVNGAGSVWTNSSDLDVGCSGSGTLSITDGGTVSNASGYLGRNSGSTGEVSVNGAGSSWINSDRLYIGDSGRGTLSISGGGGVSNERGYIAGTSTSTGEVTVDGAGSAWISNDELRVGYCGTGTLSITRGGAATGASGHVGCKSGSTGRVTVDGTGSTWTHSSDLYVGDSGDGALAITNGGTVSNAYGIVGFGLLTPGPGSAGTVTVDGAGSTWINRIDLWVGHSGSGTLSITGGATVSNTSGYVGRQPESTGTVLVDGPGSTWSSSNYLYIGESGSGTLFITSGGNVSCKRGYIGYKSTLRGKVAVDGPGSAWTNSDSLYVGGSGSATLSITHGGLVSVGTTLTIDRDLDGNAFVNMATGGMLAIWGDADESLSDFLDLIVGTDAIRYWDDGTADWASLTGATLGEDYTLRYLSDGDLAGYTLLTVGTIPEPGPCVLLAGAVAVFLARRARRSERGRVPRRT